MLFSFKNNQMYLSVSHGGSDTDRRTNPWTQRHQTLHTLTLTSHCHFRFDGVVVTWEWFGAWFCSKASCPDHLHLQLAFLIHQTNLNITCIYWRDTSQNETNLHSCAGAQISYIACRPRLLEADHRSHCSSFSTFYMKMIYNLILI